MTILQTIWFLGDLFNLEIKRVLAAILRFEELIDPIPIPNPERYMRDFISPSST